MRDTATSSGSVPPLRGGPERFPGLSSLTGEFEAPEEERTFRLESWESETRSIRFVSLACAGAYALGAGIDLVLHGGDARLWLLFALRAIVVGTLGLTAHFVSRTPFRPERLDRIVFAAAAIVVAGTCAIVAITGGDPRFHALTAVVIVLVFYLFLPNPLLAIALVAGFQSVGFLIVAWAWLPSTASDLLLVALYVVLVNLLGGFAARVMRRSARLQFAALEAEKSVSHDLRQEVAARARAEGALASSEARHRSLVELSPDGIVLHRNGKLIYMNPAAAALVGASSPDSTTGRSIFEYIVPEDRELAAERLQRVTSTGLPGGPTEFRIRRENGQIMVCEVVSGVAPSADGIDVQSVVRDITDRKRLEDEFKRLAATDYLTGARNRRAFFEQAETEWRRARRHRRSLSVLMLDVDRFKRINDAHGHSVGDDVLRLLVAACRRILRAEDILGRYGGEEFVALLPEVDIDGAVSVAERLRAQASGTAVPAGRQTVRFSVSIGVTEAQLTRETLDDALRRADDALYDAKNSGRDRVCRR
ncbi:MAG: sensor domain-containing diguanylate cyclase [Acidobacteriota bacterium]